MFTSDDLKTLEIGQPFPASQWDVAVDIMSRPFTGPAVSVGPLGVALRADTKGLVLRWGKLDATLSTGSSAAVSLWRGTNGSWGEWDEDSGLNWTCFAPPLLSSGSIASGKWVLVGIVNGRKVVVLPEC